MPSEFLGDRPSSRVLNAPGGKQSINIFGGEESAAPQPRAPPAANVPAVPQQMVGAAGGRVTLRTEHTGMTVGNVSSRVLAAPGGASSMSAVFGYQTAGTAAPTAPVAPPPTHQAVPPAPVAAPIAAQPQMAAAGQRVELRTEHTGITIGNVSSRVLATPGGASSMASIIGGSSASASDRIAALKAKREGLADATNVAPMH